MTDHIADASKMVLDLDKLEALADKILTFDLEWYVLRDCVVAPGGGVAPYHIANVPDETRRAFIAAANPATIKSLIASAREDAAEIEKLREALKPFSRAVNDYLPETGDGWPIGDGETSLTLGDLRRARAAQMDGEG